MTSSRRMARTIPARRLRALPPVDDRSRNSGRPSVHVTLLSAPSKVTRPSRSHRRRVSMLTPMRRRPQCGCSSMGVLVRATPCPRPRWGNIQGSLQGVSAARTEVAEAHVHEELPVQGERPAAGPAGGVEELHAARPSTSARRFSVVTKAVGRWKSRSVLGELVERGSDRRTGMGRARRERSGTMISPARLGACRATLASPDRAAWWVVASLPQPAAAPSRRRRRRPSASGMRPGHGRESSQRLTTRRAVGYA